MVGFDLVRKEVNGEVIRKMGAEDWGGTFYAVFDSNGKKIISSQTPNDVQGFNPERFLGRNHLKKALQSSPNITVQELSSLLNEFEPKDEELKKSSKPIRVTNSLKKESSS